MNPALPACRSKANGPFRHLTGLQALRCRTTVRSAWLLRVVALAALSVVALAVKSFLASAFIRVASDAKQQAEDETAAVFLIDWIRNTRGPLGFLLFYIMQVSAIVACVPCSSTFDYSAGAAFGLWPGVLMVVLGKGTAAVLSFFLTRSLSNGPLGRWARRRMGGGSEGALVTTAARFDEGVKQGGLRFCILLRLSPLPSWVSNYVLSLTGVAFPLYAASMIGMTPPLMANVYQGFVAAGIACSLSGKEGCTFGKRDGMGLALLTSCQWLMGVVLAQQMAKFALDARQQNDSSTGAVESEPRGDA